MYIHPGSNFTASSLSVENVSLSSASENGSVVNANLHSDSYLSFTRSNFTRCTSVASGYGGGIYLTINGEADVNMQHCTFIECACSNVALSMKWNEGGGTGGGNVWIDCSNISSLLGDEGKSKWEGTISEEMETTEQEKFWVRELDENGSVTKEGSLFSFLFPQESPDDCSDMDSSEERSREESSEERSEEGKSKESTETEVSDSSDGPVIEKSEEVSEEQSKEQLSEEQSSEENSEIWSRESKEEKSEESKEETSEEITPQMSEETSEEENSKESTETEISDSASSSDGSDMTSEEEKSEEGLYEESEANTQGGGGSSISESSYTQYIVGLLAVGVVVVVVVFVCCMVCTITRKRSQQMHADTHPHTTVPLLSSDEMSINPDRPDKEIALTPIDQDEDEPAESELYSTIETYHPDDDDGGGDDDESQSIHVDFSSNAPHTNTPTSFTPVQLLLESTIPSSLVFPDFLLPQFV